MDDYPPIADYAVIGDCRTAALISRTASIDWLCLPHFSGRSWFSAILDRNRGGRLRVGPRGGGTPQERRYLPDTNVLETTLAGPDGVVRVTDLMPILPGQARTLHPMREVLRFVEAMEGTPEIELVCDPRPNYGAAHPGGRQLERSSWYWSHGSGQLTLRTDLPLEGGLGSTGLVAKGRLRRGRRYSLSLAYDQRDVAVLPPLGVGAEKRLEETVTWWRTWCAKCLYQGPYKPAVMRSLLTLKLLTYSISGAVVAAPTTSLPEHFGGIRNWDYRYCWLRDASMTFRTFFDMGFGEEGGQYLGWLLHATALTRPRLQVLYDVYGETRLPERELDHLEGYGGARPVRIGNAACDQFQLDIYGAVILAACAYVQRGGRLDASEHRMLRELGDQVVSDWNKPDEGIWEVRAARRHHVYSKAMCWAALDQLLKLHEAEGIRIPVEQYRTVRADIRDAIEARGYSRDLGSYVSSFGDEVADASVLRLAHIGYLPPDHPRMISTFDYVDRRLGRGCLMYRYLSVDDGLPPKEGAFGLCSFWAVDYLALRGAVDAAAKRFEALLRYASDLGLYAEEIEPDTGAAMGNFPQAFTHLGLISAAATLARSGAAHGRSDAG
ncbi:MAG: glycoside hydrolase family 15 protein [Sphingobacteriales bacterium]